VAETHPQYTADGVEITEGLEVWTNNMSHTTVTIAGTAADPESRSYRYWDGWFEMANGELMNGERLAVRRPR